MFLHNPIVLFRVCFVVFVSLLKTSSQEAAPGFHQVAGASGLTTLRRMLRDFAAVRPDPRPRFCSRRDPLPALGEPRRAVRKVWHQSCTLGSVL